MKFWIGALIGMLMTTGASAQTSETESQPRFIQDRFCISFWVDPPVDDKARERYAEMAEANFNVVMGGFGATTMPLIKKQLDLCQEFGLKVLVAVPGRSYDNLAQDHPALWGYHWVDEPSADSFPGIAKNVADIRKLRPGKLTHVNLYPDYAPVHALGTPTYDAHVAKFVEETKPDVLCMDHYPMFRPGEKDGRDAYCGNLEVMRVHSVRAGIPFWNFFNTMPFGPHTDPTEAQLRWQIYSAVAYGAKGVLYFCYFTPGPGGEFPKGGAIIDRLGRRTRHFEEAKRLNAELKALGPTLMKLTSTRVTRIGKDTTVSTALEGSAVRNIASDVKPDLLIGEFSNKDGGRAVLLQNYEFAYSSWPTVEFNTAGQVVEIDKSTGKEIPPRDDSPDRRGLQISLDAGEGRLFLLK